MYHVKELVNTLLPPSHPLGNQHGKISFQLRAFCDVANVKLEMLGWKSAALLPRAGDNCQRQTEPGVWMELSGTA